MLGSLFRRLAGQRPEPAHTPAPSPPPVDEARTDAPATVEAAGTESDLLVSSLEMAAPAGMAGKSPVFSSRAVRDATVVTGTIESLTRFVAGQDVLDDLTWRLESLTTDQVNFLQLSAEPGLIQRAQARSETLKGAKAAALRKLLTDLAGGAIPEPASRANPLSMPKGPIVPPLASLQPRMAAPGDAAPAAPILGPANPAPPAPGAPSLTTAPPLATRPIPPAPAKPVQPPPAPPMPPLAKVPAAPPATAPLPPLPVPPDSPAPPRLEPVEAKAPPPAAEAKVLEPKPAAVRAPEPAVSRPAEPVTKAAPAKAPEPVSAEPVAPPKATPPQKAPEPARIPEPPKAQAEPPKPAPAPEPASLSVPRLGRQDAEARRARLLASLNDTLSSSEAAP